MSALIRTKIQIPPKPQNMVARPHLATRLNAVPHPKLILVSAPAGFGKTLSISQWLHQCAPRTAWLSLDTSDNDPVTFWNYLLFALDPPGVEINPELSQMAGTDQKAVVTALINVLVELSDPIKLVLDDYHLITESSVHRALEVLLNHMPPQVTLVIITRADPPFPLAQMRARGEMIELRTADLRFSPDEVHVFLDDIMGLSLTREQAEILAQRTEGWPAGLQLAGLALHGHTDHESFINEFAGSHHYIVEYLTEEVVRQQPEDVKHFLLETAHLKYLCAPLCETVTEKRHSNDIFAYLQARNLFVIALDASHTWYRYHHLFAELLRHRQRQQLDAELIRNLYERASDWHHNVDQIPEAIEYALTGKAYTKAVNLLEAHWHVILHHGELYTLRHWLNALPSHYILSSGPLNMAYCWLHYLADEADFIEARLAEVQRIWDRHSAANTIPDREAWIILPSLMETIAAILALQHHDPQTAVEQARQALALIPDDNRVNRDLLIGSAQYRLAQAYKALGHLEEAIDTMQDVLERLKQTSNFIGLVHGTYDTIHLYLSTNQFDNARELCDRTLDYVSQRGYAHLPLVGLLHIAHAEIALADGQLDVSQKHLNIAKIFVGDGQYEPLAMHLDRLRRQLAADAEHGAILPEPLTEREQEVLALLSAGYSNQQIADRLVITEDTVKRHNTHIYGKLNVSNRTQAVLRAQELSLL